ncbi:hypothetical protein DBR33_02665 [Stenotrophomonas sp. HMWF022]|nr:hypothetical protein DBR20_00865 [Stenotrophomonas sp. HMWF023]PTT56287.1 hypothetical protein DBR33_02665 [Stenotrophomonas sp. HMWF022]
MHCTRGNDEDCTLGTCSHICPVVIESNGFCRLSTGKWVPLRGRGNHCRWDRIGLRLDRLGNAQNLDQTMEKAVTLVLSPWFGGEPCRHRPERGRQFRSHRPS